MRTLGLGLASTGGSTGICEIDWESRTSFVEVGKFDDGLIASRVKDVQADGGWTAIDAPFGFPAAFSRAVSDWFNRGTVMADSDHDIRRRISDAYVATRQAELKSGALPGGWNPWPLSSVVDLITPSVIRCARILTAVHGGQPVDRIGLNSRVVEAYPVATLRVWGVATQKYKSTASDCDLIFENLCGRAGVRRPELRGKLATGCDDDAVDAFVCALLARTVALSGGATGPARVEKPSLELPVIETEGWIHLPPPGHRLEDLAGE